MRASRIYGYKFCLAKKVTVFNVIHNKEKKRIGKQHYQLPFLSSYTTNDLIYKHTFLAFIYCYSTKVPVTKICSFKIIKHLMHIGLGQLKQSRLQLQSKLDCIHIRLMLPIIHLDHAP
jgi:hypothetical protein